MLAGGKTGPDVTMERHWQGQGQAKAGSGKGGGRLCWIKEGNKRRLRLLCTSHPFRHDVGKKYEENQTSSRWETRGASLDPASSPVLVRLDEAVRMSSQHSSTGHPHRYAPLRNALDGRTTTPNVPLLRLRQTLPLLPIPCLPSLWPSLSPRDTRPTRARTMEF